MKIEISAALSALTLSAGQGPIDKDLPPPCPMKIGVAIACLGESMAATTNAADAYSVYGLDRARISQEPTKAYLARFGCFRIFEDGHPYRFERVTGRAVAEPNGSVRVGLVEAKNGQHVVSGWVADPYFVNTCATPPRRQ